MLNKKGFTIVELIVSFAFVSIVTVSLFALVVNYKNKQQNVSTSTELLTFKSKLTIEIQNDIQRKLLDKIEYCIEPTGDITPKCVVFTFRNGETKRLVIKDEEKVDNIVNDDGTVSNFSYRIPYILYGNVRYIPPDAKNIYIRSEYMLEKTTLDDDLENNMALYKVRVLLEHEDLDGDMDLSIVALGTTNIKSGQTPTYTDYLIGQRVNVQLSGTLMMPFYVLKNSSGYKDSLVLIAESNVNTSNFNPTGSNNNYIGSAIKSSLDFATSSWTNPDVIRLVTAEEVGYIVLACPKYKQINAPNLNISSAGTYLTSSNYWTMTAANDTTPGEARVWYVNGTTRVLQSTPITTSGGVRPVIEINKRYVTHY